MMGRLQPMQYTGPRLAGLGTRLLRLLPTAPEGEEEPAGTCAALVTHAHDAGPGVGGHPDHGDVVEVGPRPRHSLAVGCPAASAGDLGEPDGQAEGYAVTGQLEHLVSEGGLADVPFAPGGVGAVLDGQGAADGEGAGVAWVGGGERYPGRVGADQGAAGEGLDHEAALVDYAGLHAPREERPVEGAAVPAVPHGEGAGELASVDHATAPVGGSWLSMPATGARSSSSRTSLRSFQPARMALSWAW